jgi:hypothetical protein
MKVSMFAPPDILQASDLETVAEYEEASFCNFAEEWRFFVFSTFRFVVFSIISCRPAENA